MRKAFIFSALLTILSTASAQQLDIAQSGHFATLKLSSEQYADWNDDAFSKNDATVQTYTKLLYENLSDDFDFIVLASTSRMMSPALVSQSSPTPLNMAPQAVSSKSSTCPHETSSRMVPSSTRFSTAGQITPSRRSTVATGAIWGAAHQVR